MTTRAYTTDIDRLRAALPLVAKDRHARQQLKLAIILAERAQAALAEGRMEAAESALSDVRWRVSQADQTGKYGLRA